MGHKYKLTDEHRAQLEPWAQKWIANAMSTSAMTAHDRDVCRDAVRRLYRAANLEPPPDERIVFVSSPLIACYAAGFAAWIWHLRKRGAKAAMVATEADTQDATEAATWAVTRAATEAATEAATAAATWAATEDATEDATEAATWTATWDATRAATEAVTWAATRATTVADTRATTVADTRDATWAATEAAAMAATVDAARAATWDDTQDATEAATWAATRAAIRAAITRAAAMDTAQANTRATTVDATETATETAIWAATRAATEAATRDATMAATWDDTRTATWAAAMDTARDATWAATEDATWAAADTFEKPPLANWYVFPDTRALAARIGVHQDGLTCSRLVLRLWQGGNQWSYYDSYISFFRHVAKLPIDYSKWDAWETLSLRSGPRIVHKDFCIISDRPEVLTVDSRNRPHNETGPFCRWRDGAALYSIHGVRTPAWIVEHPEKITMATINEEQNTEVQRVMIERFGWERYAEESNASIIDHNERWGTLCRADGGLFVRVVNSSPEPDGSFRRYILPVLDNCQPIPDPDDSKSRAGAPQRLTALNAVASTFGLTGAEYKSVLGAES